MYWDILFQKRNVTWVRYETIDHSLCFPGIISFCYETLQLYEMHQVMYRHKLLLSRNALGRIICSKRSSLSHNMHMHHGINDFCGHVQQTKCLKFTAIDSYWAISYVSSLWNRTIQNANIGRCCRSLSSISYWQDRLGPRFQEQQ